MDKLQGILGLVVASFVIATILLIVEWVMDDDRDNQGQSYGHSSGDIHSDSGDGYRSGDNRQIEREVKR